MTPAESVVAALLDGDLTALGALQDHPVVGEVARAGLARLAPNDLTAADLEVLRAVGGHPGLSAAELTDRVGPAFAAAGARLRALGLLSAQRFERADCWTRTAEGTQVLRRHDAVADGPPGGGR